MVVGLIQSGQIRLTAWVPSGHSRAMWAQSTVRRLTRGLEHERLAVPTLDGPVMPHAMAEWGAQRVSRALDPSMWWTTSCWVRVARVYRGRAIPLVGTVRAHPSSRVASHVYQEMLAPVAELRPCQCPVVWTADRGFAATHLLAQRTRLGWQGRLRSNGSCGVDRAGKRRGPVTRLPCCAGQALCWPQVDVTTPGSGPVHLALGRPQGSPDDWGVVRAEPTEAKTCEAYGWRCDIAAHV